MFDLKIVLPILSAIFVVACVIVGIEFNTSIDFGFAGFLAFLVVCVGFFGVCVLIISGISRATSGE